MKSILISTAIILAIGLGGAWAERLFAGLAHAALAHQPAATSPA